jgi:hypothetical protein
MRATSHIGLVQAAATRPKHPAGCTDGTVPQSTWTKSRGRSRTLRAEPGNGARLSALEYHVW